MSALLQGPWAATKLICQSSANGVNLMLGALGERRRISSGSFVHRKGFGFRFASLTKRLIAACRVTMEWNTPRLSLRLVSLAK